MRFSIYFYMCLIVLVGCSSAPHSSQDQATRHIDGCVNLPQDADFSRSEKIIARWCLQGMYVDKTGAMKPLPNTETALTSSESNWDGGNMPTMQTSSPDSDSPSIPPIPTNPIVLKVPEGE